MHGKGMLVFSFLCVNAQDRTPILLTIEVSFRAAHEDRGFGGIK